MRNFVMPDRGRISFRRDQLGQATWQTALDATAVGKLEKFEGKKDKRYTEFVSASPAAVCGSLLDPPQHSLERVANGHDETLGVFDRYNRYNARDVVEAMRKVLVSRSSTRFIPEWRKHIK
jgi:hypothetical protein